MALKTAKYRRAEEKKLLTGCAHMHARMQRDAEISNCPKLASRDSRIYVSKYGRYTELRDIKLAEQTKSEAQLKQLRALVSAMRAAEGAATEEGAEGAAPTEGADGDARAGELS